MRSSVLTMLLVAGLVASSAAAGTPSKPETGPAPTAAGQADHNIQPDACGGQRASVDCGISRKDIKQARAEYVRGLRLSKTGNTAEALTAFQTAARLVPRHPEYANARELARQQMVAAYVQNGSQLLLGKRTAEAVAAFRQALEIDPGNPYAGEKLQQAIPSPVLAGSTLRVVEGPEVMQARPRQEKKSFHFSGEGRTLLEQVSSAYGIHATFAEGIQSRPVKLDIEAVDFETAMEAAGKLTKTFWVALTQEEILVANNTRDQHDQYDRMAMRVFYLPQITTVAQINDIVNALRTIFEIRFIVPQPGNNSIAVRAPSAQMEAATRFLKTLDAGPPQVMLEIDIYEVSRTLTRSLGLSAPLEWQSFNVTQDALKLLQQPNVQDLVNQLFSSGGINQAGSTAIAALLGQLQSQQNSLLSKPFATFGGGSTLSAVPVPPATATFSRGESMMRLIDHMNLRAAQGDPATLKIGSRYPILNTTFAPIFNSGALSQVIQGGSFTAPFPSFNYEDLGINIKATPQIHPGEVALALEVEVKSLGAQTFNGIPVISNRAYKGAIRVKDGEHGVVAGSLDRQEQRSVSGPAGLGRLPIAGSLLSNYGNQNSETELLIVITPHLMTVPPETQEAVLLQ